MLNDRLTELVEEYMRGWREDRLKRNREPLMEAIELERRGLRHTRFSHVANLPAMVAPFSIVIPGNFWLHVAADEVEVACPCGSEPRMHSGVPVVCSGEECPRAYLYTGREVLVAFSPRGTEPVEEPDPVDEM
jgi:hypothetical protein